MLPTEKNGTYPEFVPDQLLMSEHLNSLFGYLEEGERLTRANLIGIGVVCGLEVRLNAASTELTITKGCGVTSSGYLVTMPQVTYTHFKTFDAAKPIYYDRFVTSAHQPKFHLDLLTPTATEEGTTPLTKAFLSDKVVLIFVELLEEQAKNCEPNSCDDKGASITVTFRPLLINKKDVYALSASTANTGLTAYYNFSQLPELHLRRFDVPATRLAETIDIINAYRKVLDAAFLTKMESALTQAYSILLPYLVDVQSTNPFSGLAADYHFLYQNPITQNQLLDLQYYYDFFSDLILAYEELRRKTREVVSICCPDEQLFPRHLLLGDAVSDTKVINRANRYYFIPSPAIACHRSLIGEIRFLFQRLAVMIDSFEPPTLFASSAKERRFTANFRETTVNVRITPSKYGDVPLSQKALPYYYAPETLVRTWNFDRTRSGSEYQILSYHAPEYNATDDHVREPLKYDLEPYNFLRIEGHLGKRYTEALRSIQALKQQYRLPFEIVVLSADTSALRAHLADQTALFAQARTFQSPVAGQVGDVCQFQDLEVLYDTLVAEMICCLCKQMKYFYNRPTVSRDGGNAVGDGVPPKAALLKRCDPQFLVQPGTVGSQFELLYDQYNKMPYQHANAFLSFNSFSNLTTGFSSNAGSILFALLYYIEKLSEALPATLSAFDISVYHTRLNDMKAVAQAIINLLSNNDDQSEDIKELLDHLNAVKDGCCSFAAMESLYKDYLIRKLYVMMLHQFGYFTRLHPGIQHKGGVPMGGTFILVYHERVVRRQPAQLVATPLPQAATTVTFARDEKAAVGAAPAAATVNTLSNASGIQQAVNTTSVLVAPHVLPYTLQKELEALLLNRVVVPKDIEALIATIPDGTVIADFFLPYLAYSNCPPVQFIINEQKQPDPVTISITPTQFCNNDAGSYTPTVAPTGGAVTGEGTSINADNNPVFKPSAVVLSGNAKKDVVITYTVNGENATTTVTVFAAVSDKLSIKAVQGQFHTAYIFTAQNGEPADKFEWTFSDGATSTDTSPTHDFGTPGTYTVTLKASNGPCSATATITITIAEEGQVTLTMNPTSFCNNDKTLYQPIASPAGGTFSGEGVIDDTALNIKAFQPSAVALGTADQKTVKLSYKSGSQTATANVVVFQKPTAGFDIVISPTGSLLVQFKNTSKPVQNSVWDFGDGEKSEADNPEHVYKESGTYKVTLKASNGPCSDTISKDVVFKPTGPSKTCAPLTSVTGAFDKLESVSKDQFAILQKSQLYEDMLNVFGQIKDLLTSTTAKQIDFFVKNKTPDTILGWLGTLDEMIRNTKTQLIGFAVYRMLADLAMYISCIQTGDVDKADAATAAVYNQILRQLKSWTTLFGNADAATKAQLKALLQDFKDELGRVNANGEAATKPAYVNFLNQIIEILSSFPL